MHIRADGRQDVCVSVWITGSVKVKHKLDATTKILFVESSLFIGILFRRFDLSHKKESFF